MGHGTKKFTTKRKLEQACLGRPKVDGELTKDISEWAISINESAKEGPPSGSTKECSLFRVPAKIRQLNEGAYSPELVSIGPFYSKHINENEKEFKFKDMEEHKHRYLWYMLNKLHKQRDSAVHKDQAGSSNPVGNICMENLVKAMWKLETEARNCYSEKLDKINSEEFVKMMLLDGCFVIQLMRFYYARTHYQEPVDDPIFTVRWMLPVLQRDLLLLENQLPFFVLKELFELTKIDEKTSLVELTLKFFDPLLPREEGILESKCKTTERYDHLLAVFRSSFTPTSEKEASQNEGTPVEYRRLVLSVTELEEAGVKFRTPQKLAEEEKEKMEEKGKLENLGVKFRIRQKAAGAVNVEKCRDLIDIQFKGRVLEMPPLMVDDYTKPLFLNLIAYEQCCPNTHPYFTDYILFFDSIVNSPQDVEILHYEGIIDHVLGSDEAVAKLFNELSAGVVYELEDCYLSHHVNEINNFTNRRWRRWRKKLIQKKKNSLRGYFRNPWTIVSLVAGTFLLLLTLIQTFTPFIPYLRTSKDSNHH